MQWVLTNDRTGAALSKPVALLSDDSYTHKAAPDPRIAELLWVTAEISFSLAAQEACEGIGREGETVLLAVAKGSVAFESAHVQGKLFGGQVMIFPPSSNTCALTANGTCSVIALSLAGSLVESVLHDCFAQDMLFCAAGLADMMEAVSALTDDDIGMGENSAAAYRLLMHLRKSAARYEENEGYPPLIEAALGIIQEEFAMIDGVDEIAARLEVTSNHLIRQFTRVIGTSPGRYLRLRRIEYAKSLLTQPGMTVSLTADLSGFSGANYFAKVFRKETGMSPREYAASHAPNERDETAVRGMLDMSVL